MEVYLGRELRDNEVTHHLDCNPLNNLLSNLIVLENSMHMRLHAWINRGSPIHENYKFGENVLDRYKNVKTINTYCKVCELTLQEKQEHYCSEKCRALDKRRVEWPSKEVLTGELENNSYCALGRKYGVSDNAVRKWARHYGIL